MCSSNRTHLCIASFLPAFRISYSLSAPRGPLRDIIRYMHKAERAGTNEPTNVRARARTALGHPTRPGPRALAAPPNILRALLRDPKLKTFITRRERHAASRRLLRCISREDWARCPSYKLHNGLAAVIVSLSHCSGVTVFFSNFTVTSFLVIFLRFRAQMEVLV